MLVTTVVVPGGAITILIVRFGLAARLTVWNLNKMWPLHMALHVAI